LIVSADDSSFDDNKTDFIRAPTVRTSNDDRTPVLLVIAGNRAGLTVKIGDTALVVGRAQHCAVWMEGAGLSREHVRIAKDSLGTVTITDLQSTNGTLVNRQKVKSQALSPGDENQLGSDTTLKFEYQSEVEESFHQERYEQGLHDSLTGLYNRQHFLAKLRQSNRLTRALIGAS